MAKLNAAKGRLVRKFGENIFGNPKYDNSLILTANHSLYKQGIEYPVRSGDIEIGDVLQGIDIDTVEYLYGNDGNYTVYDIYG